MKTSKIFLLFFGILFLVSATNLAKYYTKAESDAKYLQIADTEPATNHFYTKEITDSLVINVGTSQLLRDLKIIGSTVVSVPFSATNYGAQGAAITSGRFHGVMHIIRDTIIVDGVEFGQSVAAPNFYTREAYNGFDICSYSAGVITQITQTVSDSTVFKTFGYKRKAFPSPITLTPGIYYVRALWQASTIVTAPAFTVCTTAGSSDLTTVLNTQLKTSFYKSSQTILGSSFNLADTFGSSSVPALHLYKLP